MGPGVVRLLLEDHAVPVDLPLDGVLVEGVEGLAVGGVQGRRSREGGVGHLPVAREPQFRPPAAVGLGAPRVRLARLGERLQGGGVLPVLVVEEPLLEQEVEVPRTLLQAGPEGGLGLLEVPGEAADPGEDGARPGEGGIEPERLVRLGPGVGVGEGPLLAAVGGAVPDLEEPPGHEEPEPGVLVPGGLEARGGLVDGLLRAAEPEERLGGAASGLHVLRRRLHRLEEGVPGRGVVPLLHGGPALRHQGGGVLRRGGGGGEQARGGDDGTEEQRGAPAVHGVASGGMSGPGFPTRPGATGCVRSSGSAMVPHAGLSWNPARGAVTLVLPLQIPGREPPGPGPPEEPWIPVPSACPASR